MQDNYYRVQRRVIDSVILAVRQYKAKANIDLDTNIFLSYNTAVLSQLIAKYVQDNTDLVWGCFIDPDYSLSIVINSLKCIKRINYTFKFPDALKIIVIGKDFTDVVTVNATSYFFDLDLVIKRFNWILKEHA